MKKKDTSITFLNVLQFTARVNFPTELIDEMSSWVKICKSPYGLTFYNDTVGWSYKPHGSLRISDHWNFESKAGGLHCQTTTQVPNTTHWAIGKYDEQIKKYKILRIFEKPKLELIDNFLFKYHILHTGYNKAIKKQPENIEFIKFSYLKRYYKLLEENSINPENLPNI